MNPTQIEIERCLLILAAERGPDKTFCPSEVARRLAPDDWRNWMSPVRTVAARLVKEEKLRCTQQGKEVNPATARGPVRFSSPPP